MGATTTTGTGPGDSEGLYKPEHNTGCCNAKNPPRVETTIPKKQCASRIVAGGRTRYKAGSSSSAHKGC